MAKKKLNVYVSTDFEGRYPVGVCAVVVASDIEEARQLLDYQIHEKRLPASPDLTITKIDLSEPSAEILLDGDY